MPPPAIEHVSLAPAPVPLLLSLQRSAGNQAVQRLLRGHSPGAALQRFAQPDEKKPDFRVSKNRMIVVQGKKDLFADEEAIGEANTALAQVAGGKGSYLKLKGEKVDVPGFPGLMRVTPLWLGREGEMPELMGTLNQINKQDPTKYMSHADCHMTAQTIMGSRDEPSGIKDSEKAIVTGFTEDELTQTAVEPIAKAKTEGKISDHGANRVLDQFLITALPRFAAKLEMALQEHLASSEKAKGSKVALLYDKTIKDIRSRMSGDTVDQVRKLRLAYRAVLQDKLLRAMLGQMFSINEYADPEIGDALVQFNDEAEKKAEESKTEKFETAQEEGTATAGMAPGRDLWNFHWAGVIMRDESDYVTLENLSVENLNVKNDLWFFAMYGPLDQSFHAEAGKDPHVGQYPLTLPIRASA